MRNTKKKKKMQKSLSTGHIYIRLTLQFKCVCACVNLCVCVSYQRSCAQVHLLHRTRVLIGDLVFPKDVNWRRKEKEILLLEVLCAK